MTNEFIECFRDIKDPRITIACVEVMKQAPNKTTLRAKVETAFKVFDKNFLDNMFNLPFKKYKF